MYNQFASRAASRAQWLAELSVTLDEAQTLLSQLVAQRIDPAEAELLRIRVAELRNDVRLLHWRGFLPYQPIETSHLLEPGWRRRD